MTFIDFFAGVGGNQAYARYEKFDKQRKALDKKLLNGENAI